MKPARDDAARERDAEPAHRAAPKTAHASRRVAPVPIPWWLVGTLVPAALVLFACVTSAVAWVDRPFAGFLFSDSGIVFSIGRSAWRVPSLRQIEWAHITAVDGKPIADATAIDDTLGAAGTGADVTYTLRRGTEVFRLAIPVQAFTWADFAVVFAPMLGVGAWIVAVGATLVALRRESPEVRALFAVCVSLGLMLITGPDQYGPYRFIWLNFVCLAMLPPTVLHLAAAFLWRGQRGGRVIAVLYVVFFALGIALVAFRNDPALFLPLLYIVYCALANALLLYAGTLVSALVSGERFRPQVVLALAAILGSAGVITVLVTYPLRTEPVSVPWFILPLGLWPLLHGFAFVTFDRPTAPPRAAP